MRHKKLFALIVGVMVLAIMPRSQAEIKDHPVIRPISGFVLNDSQFENFSSYTFEFEQNGKSIEKQVKGKYWFLYYEYQKEDRKYSKLEIIENHKQAALEKGGTILGEDDTKLDFTLPKPDGGTIWAHLHTWENSYELYIIEEKGFSRGLFFGADEMKKKLDAAGHVALYGIYFDSDKSNLKLGSEKTLIEIVKLMKNYPDLTIEIQGHTDSTGTREHNVKLSESRAETVKSFLLLYGINAPRMAARGYGPENPVAPNETEKGRALNRRVELKRLK